jgi:hypothetical protein
METGGRPTRPSATTRTNISTSFATDRENVAFDEELRKWKTYLDYRQKQEAEGRMEVQLKEKQFAEAKTQVELRKDYRAYQQLEVEDAKQWVEFWQLQVQEFQEICALEGWTSTAERYHFKTENCAIPRQRSAKASPACRDAVEMGRRTAFSPYRELCWLNDTGVNVTPSGRSSKVTEKDFESSFSRFCA